MKAAHSAAALGSILFALASPPTAAEAPAAPAAKAEDSRPHWDKDVQVLEPKAVAILKAASARLASARTLSFTAVIADEAQSRLGPPLLYASRSDVVLQRPDRLRIITTGAAPRSDLYLNGTKLSAYVPADGLLAQASVPPTIDGALEAAHHLAHVYFPFTDLIVADPYGDLAPDLRLAFYIGKSEAIGGVATDMVAYATDEVFIQAWIGIDDKLPRRLRAIYMTDGGNLRHEMELSNWKINPQLPASAFALPAAARNAKAIPFARPGASAPAAAKAGAPAAPAPTNAAPAPQK